MVKVIKKTSAVVLASAMIFTAVSTPVSAKSAVTLNKTSVTLEEGKSVTLKVKGTSKKVTWSTTNKKVATVTGKGKVTAKKQGSAVIKAKVSKQTLKCRVKVTAAAAAPLSQYWSPDSGVAKSLRDYVEKVTDEKDAENFIPVKDRIAVFDMDGTLICETYYTYYDMMMFIEYCLKDHPERVSDELKKAAAEIKLGNSTVEELARNFAKAYAGLTVKELYDYAVSFGQKYTSSFTNMRYIDGFYLPMVEVVKYLYDNGFTIYVVSGTERTTSRAIIANSPLAEYIPPKQVIGSEFEVKLKGHETESSNMTYKYADGDELVYTGGFIQKNLNANKTIFIEQEIGQMPVLAFGNSGSDTSMMNYALDKRNPYPSQAYMVVADDAEREWGKQDWAAKSAEYTAMGYVPVSMKNDFKQIYPEGINIAATQVAA